MNTLDKHRVPTYSPLLTVKVDRVWKDREADFNFRNYFRHMKYLQRRERLDNK